MLKRTTDREVDVGRRGRGDSDRPGRREGGQGRKRDRSEGGADRPAGRGEDRAGERQDEELGYKERVHERLDRMDARLERLEQQLQRHLEGKDA
jgi:hypothetical protein